VRLLLATVQGRSAAAHRRRRRRRACCDGGIDVIATDHAPHTAESKELPFEQAPPGMLGLETALALALTHLHGMGLVRLVEAMSIGPAAIAGVGDRHGRPVAGGEPANLCVFDPEATWVVDPARTASRSRNTPYAGHTVRGRVVHTLVDGGLMVRDGEAQR
jgi:dihydroorotase